MESVQHAPVSSGPIRALSVALALTAVALIWLAWSTAAAVTGVQRTRARDLRIAELRGTIVRLDEVPSFKGALSAVAANRAADAAGRLERLARGGDLSDVDRVHADLQHALSALLPQLKAAVAEAGRSPVGGVRG